MGISEGKDTKKIIFEAIKAENFPKLITDSKPDSNPREHQEKIFPQIYILAYYIQTSET